MEEAGDRAESAASRCKSFKNTEGRLVHSIEGCEYRIRYLLMHPEIAARLGEHGHEHMHKTTAGLSGRPGAG